MDNSNYLDYHDEVLCLLAVITPGFSRNDLQASFSFDEKRMMNALQESDYVMSCVTKLQTKDGVEFKPEVCI